MIVYTDLALLFPNPGGSFIISIDGIDAVGGVDVLVGCNGGGDEPRGERPRP